jgi:threonine synthase
MASRYLECSLNPEHRLDVDKLHTTCPYDDAPLVVRYTGLHLDVDARYRSSMWRYRDVLPIDPGEEPITLGEGGTPLLLARNVMAALRLDAPIYVKDESQNPTGSFKARGMSVAVTVAKRLGAKMLVAPSAGNAGSALAAYGAKAGLEVHVYVPADTPSVLIEQTQRFGAKVTPVDGLITDAGRLAAEFAAKSGAFNVATLREPYRVEGKKTMAYEIVEELGAIPSAIVYPTGGGTGIVGMWKAFAEMETLGWIGKERPRIFSVQSEACPTIVNAFDAGTEFAKPLASCATKVWGLRVPALIGDRLVLRSLRESHGGAVAVSEQQMMNDMRTLHASEGIDATEEGGATLSGLRELLKRGASFDGPVVLFNTGSALKYGSRG